MTGGIGSGKTETANCFAALGIHTVDADIAARIVVAPGQPALAAIAAHFGAQILDGQQLNRAALRRIVFADEDERRWLENLLHPLIGQEIERDLKTSKSPYAILVSPLLIEAGQTAYTDRVLVIDASEENQIDRTMARDDNRKSQVQAIMATQLPRTKRLTQADDIICNDGNKDSLARQVAKLHHLYLRLAREKT